MLFRRGVGGFGHSTERRLTCEMKDARKVRSLSTTRTLPKRLKKEADAIMARTATLAERRLYVCKDGAKIKGAAIFTIVQSEVLLLLGFALETTTDAEELLGSILEKAFAEERKRSAMLVYFALLAKTPGLQQVVEMVSMGVFRPHPVHYDSPRVAVLRYSVLPRMLATLCSAQDLATLRIGTFPQHLIK